MSDKSVQITVKVNPSILARADRLIESVAAERGLPATRAAVLRVALVRGLMALEREENELKRCGEQI